MKVILCAQKNNWNNQFSAEFLQSWEWGEFQKQAGLSPVRVQLEADGSVFWQAQGFEHKILGLFKFIYFPKISLSPLSAEQKNLLFDFLKNSGYIFARVESVDVVDKIDKYNLLKVKNRQPKNTFLLDIGKEEDELKSGMHAKTRYNIGLSEKRGVVVWTEKNIDVFWQLNQETSARDKFKSHNRDYYQKMLELDMVYQVTAYKDEIPIASNICINFGGVFTYLHGASSNKFRNLMATYLLQWECIKLARSCGARYYDFGGTAPVYLESDVKSNQLKVPTCFNNFCWEVAHKWTGITRFKVGFGGRGENYPDAIEVVLNKNWYKLFNFIKKYKV